MSEQEEALRIRTCQQLSLGDQYQTRTDASTHQDQHRPRIEDSPHSPARVGEQRSEQMGVRRLQPVVFREEGLCLWHTGEHEGSCRWHSHGCADRQCGRLRRVEESPHLTVNDGREMARRDKRVMNISYDISVEYVKQ